MLHRFGHVRVFMAMVAVVAALAVTATAMGIGPFGFRPAGDTRYAFKSVDVSSPATTTSSTYVDMTGMTVSLTTPADKKADLFITFNAELNGCNGLYVRAVVDSNVAAPGQALLFSHAGGSAEAHGFTWSRSVGPGAHTVRIQWLVLTGCSQGFAGVRTLFVIANIY
jgi:hypothetical protein